ncbi:MAG: penicillin-binding protein 1C [Hyphomicrobium sp.]
MGVVVIAGLSLVATWSAVRVAAVTTPPPSMVASEVVSTIVVDRKGQLLRAFTTADGRWRLPVEPGDVDPRYLAMLTAFEDRRFRDHNGVDPVAFVRSGFETVRHGRIISGGSTLTMQVARLLDGRHEKTGRGKLRQIVRALQLEGRLSKDDILRLYLRLAPFGGNLEGVRAASLAYFGKEPKRLSLSEAALLVALPQSPEVRRLDRNSPSTRRARDLVLRQAVAAGVISEAEAEHARAEAIPTVRREFPKLAPHLSEAEIARDAKQPVHRLTLDRELQSAMELLVAEQTELLGPRLSAALIAADHTTGEVIAYVGSPGYFESARFGAIDMVDAVRSPGSTLKPLIYGLGFEQGIIHPETLIEDKPVRFGSYAPENFDDDFHGTVTIREALGQSLNIPAVKVLNAVGPGRLTGRLKRAQVATVMPPETQASLAIALGGIGMRLKDVADLYAGLARGGDPISLHWRPADKADKRVSKAVDTVDTKRRRLLSLPAAWYVTDILKDAPPPPNTKAGRIAYKTGTSYGYRDAWAAGYDGRHTIVVWVGRPDSVPTPGMIGRTAAAPILFDAFARVAERRAPFRPAPGGVLRSTGAELPPPLKRFREGPDDTVASGPFVESNVLIAFPPDRAELEMEAEDGASAMVLKAEGGALPLTWMIDGQPVSSDPRRRELVWQPEAKGFVKLQVVDAKGRVDRVTVRLK